MSLIDYGICDINKQACYVSNQYYISLGFWRWPRNFQISFWIVTRELFGAHGDRENGCCLTAHSFHIECGLFATALRRPLRAARLWYAVFFQARSCLTNEQQRRKLEVRDKIVDLIFCKCRLIGAGYRVLFLRRNSRSAPSTSRWPSFPWSRSFPKYLIQFCQPRLIWLLFLLFLSDRSIIQDAISLNVQVG